MKRNIIYKRDVVPQIEQIIAVYDDSGINRPTHEVRRVDYTHLPYRFGA